MVRWLLSLVCFFLHQHGHSYDYYLRRPSLSTQALSLFTVAFAASGCYYVAKQTHYLLWSADGRQVNQLSSVSGLVLAIEHVLIVCI